LNFGVKGITIDIEKRGDCKIYTICRSLFSRENNWHNCSNALFNNKFPNEK